MSPRLAQLRRRSGLVTGSVLALLAYLPALTASPGSMVSDSKLYLYLDPGRFLGDNLYTFDPRQFAGWVPHQHISYLWPSGPWYWLFETLGFPDWVSHRLWIGTVLLLAGLGARWAARLLGFSAAAAATAAVLYQVTPYVLPYVSRTSVMLLPFAGLGWIVGLTVLATRRSGWGAPAGIALVVLTVGAVNATALAMIVPGPLLWLLHSTWAGNTSVRRALTVAGQTAVLSLGISLWWVAMLAVQARHGVDVIAFSEALEDVALTSTAPEVLRSLGYWLFYVRDSFGPATSESLGYLTSSRFILLSYAVPVAGAFGLVAVRWVHRRFAVWLVGAGILLGVGVHPTDDPAPLMDLLTGGGEAGLAEALRSSTRALPLVALGLGLGAASVVEALPRIGRVRNVPWDGVRHAAAAGLALLAVVNLPALWTGGFTDPVLEREQDPPASWLDAAADLDEHDSGGRVLQLPGAEFGTFRWGHTVDQPLPGLTERPLVTRDLLPLGSAAAMDLVFALDDRAQSGVLEPASVAPTARLLGADTVWGANDSAFERYRTARPEVVQATLGEADGLTREADYGDPVPNVPTRRMYDEEEIVREEVGEAMSDVTLWSVDDPVTVVRAASEAVYVSGSADGLIDMAASGALDPDAVHRYTASLDDADLAEVAASGAALVVTDSNRDRAHHWRSSQDVVGATESGGAGSEVLEEVVGDERLDVFGLGDGLPAETQTVAVQEGPVRVAASSYGEAFAYRPEDRAVMAVDGDDQTAWRTADRADAVGEYLELRADRDVDRVRILQPERAPHARVITAVDVQVGIAAPVRIPLTKASLVGEGETFEIPPVRAGTPLRITIAETSVPAVLTPETLAAVGFAEVDLGLGATTEWIRPPVDALAENWPGGVTTVLTRHRVDPLDRWRDDPEPALQRMLRSGTLASGEIRTEQVDVTLRLHQRATDDVLHRLLGLEDLPGLRTIASDRLTGSWSAWGQAATDGDPATAWRSPFAAPTAQRLTVRHGAERVRRLRLLQPEGVSPITRVRIISNGERQEVDVPDPDEDGYSTIRLPEPVRGPQLTLVVTEVEERTTVDPRYGEITILPSGISELEIPGADPPVELPDEVQARCTTGLLTLDAEGVPLSFTVSTDDFLSGAAAEATLCAGLGVADGAVRLRSTPGRRTGLDVDRVVIGAPDVSPVAARPVTAVVDSGRLDRTIRVSGCADGCWLVLGEGFNEAWAADEAGADLGAPVLVDGGFNGWRLPAGEDERLVHVEWTAQAPLTLAFILTLLTLLVSVVLVAVSARRRRSAVPSAPGVLSATYDPRPRRSPERVVLIAVAVWVASCALLVDWSWGVVAALCSVVLVRTRRAEALAPAGWAGIVAVGLALVILQAIREPFPNGGWPLEFSELHEVTLFAVVSLVVGASMPFRADEGSSPTIDRS